MAPNEAWQSARTLHAAHRSLEAIQIRETMSSSDRKRKRTDADGGVAKKSRVDDDAVDIGDYDPALFHDDDDRRRLMAMPEVSSSESFSTLWFAMYTSMQANPHLKPRAAHCKQDLHSPTVIEQF